jgi:hypothetical protein
MEYTDGIYAVLLRKWYAQYKNCKFSSSSPKASRLCGWLPRVQSILPSSSVHAGIILFHDLMHIIFTSMNFLQFFPALLKHKKTRSLTDWPYVISNDYNTGVWVVEEWIKNRLLKCPYRQA